VELEEEGAFYCELRILDLRSGVVTVLLRSKNRDYIEDLCPSPDGSQVAYVHGEWNGRTRKDGSLPMTVSLKVISLTDRIPLEILPLDEDWVLWRMKYLGSERVLYGRYAGRDSSDKTLISIVNVRTRKVDRTLKANLYTEIWPAADGKTLVLDDQGP
jgi:hypothetical protein